MSGITKLTSANYITWLLQVRALLDPHELHCFIAEMDQTPPAKVTVDGVTKDNPILASWTRQDRMLYSVILGTLSLAVQPVVSRAITTRDVWMTLASTYGKPSRAHIK